MIHCIPQSLLSQSYDIRGDGQSAVVMFNWFSEQGDLYLENQKYRISKKGVFSGAWEMKRGGEAIAAAQKLNAFTRTIEIRSGFGTHTLEAQSMFTRAMMLSGLDSHCTFVARAFWSRRYRIDGQIPDFEITCFAFWLVAILERRQRHS